MAQLAEEKEGASERITGTKSGDCNFNIDFDLLTTINVNKKNPRKSTLNVYCKQISTRAIFEDDFTTKQLRKAGFAGIRSYEQLEKAKNLIDIAFAGDEEDTSLDVQVIPRDQVAKFLNDSDDEELAEDAVNNFKLEEKQPELDSEEETPAKTDSHDGFLALHLVKEDEFVLLQCKLVLKQTPRKEVEILREIIDEMKQQLMPLSMKEELMPLSMKHQLMPIGSIIMWSGSRNNVPRGWALCDGRNGKPDLRNRFIVAAGGKYSHGSTGGSEQHKHQVRVEPHTLTVSEMPRHSHGYVYETSRCHIYDGNDSNRTNFYPYQNQDETSTRCTGGDQAHSHGANCPEVSHLPPYYALCFIILQDPPHWSEQHV